MTRRLFAAFAAVALFLVWPDGASACTGVNFKTKRSQSVRVIYRTKVSHPQRHFAEATHDPKSGRPLIVYYRRYNSAPGYFKSFIRRHECCHHSIERAGGNAFDEIAANCCALRGMSRSARAAVGKYIVRREINSYAWVQAVGIGGDFWSRTQGRCPSLAP